MPANFRLTGRSLTATTPSASSSTAVATPSSLRVLTINLCLLPPYFANAGSWNEHKMERIEAFFATIALRYDVLLLLEVWESPLFHHQAFSHPDHIIRLARHTYPYSHRLPRGRFRVLNNGLLMLSRYPLVHGGGEEYRDTTGWQNFVPRSILSAQVVVPGHAPIWLVLTHLQSGASDTSWRNSRDLAGDTQQKQIRQLRDYLNRLGVYSTTSGADVYRP